RPAHRGDPARSPGARGESDRAPARRRRDQDPAARALNAADQKLIGTCMSTRLMMPRGVQVAEPAGEEKATVASTASGSALLAATVTRIVASGEPAVGGAT